MSHMKETFTEKENEQLATLVSKNPILHDSSHPDFKNAYKRDLVWEEIGKEMNKLGSDCKLRWRNLRDVYNKQKKRKPFLQHHPRSKYDTYSKLLSFLRNDEDDESKNEDEDGEEDEEPGIHEESSTEAPGPEASSKKKQNKEFDPPYEDKTTIYKMTESFNSDEDEKLSFLISKNPILFDTTLEEYKNVMKKEAVWDEIGKQMNKSGKNCRLRWKCMRDTYQRARKRSKMTKHFIHGRSKLQKYRRLLSFLHNDSDNDNENDSVEAEASTSRKRKMVFLRTNRSDSVATNSDNEENPLADAVDIFKYGEESSNDALQSLKTRKRLRKEGLKRRRRDEGDVEVQRKTSNTVQASSTNESNDEEVELFTRQARTIIRNLPPYLQIKAMQEVFDTLTKYKMLAFENANIGNLANEPFYDKSTVKIETNYDE